MSSYKEIYIITYMTIREDIKILLVKERITLTELANILKEKTGKDYTVYGLSQKLQRSSMKYDEAQIIAETLGYKLKFEKVNID